MSIPGLCLVVFTTAFTCTYVTIFNSEKFGHFFFLIYRSPILIIYCAVYGFIGIILFSILKDNAFKIEENITLTDPYFSALLIGFATRSIANITFFTIKQGVTPLPIGLKTITLVIDKRFDEECKSICFDRFHSFITPYVILYKDVDFGFLKKQIVEILSAYPSPEKVASFSVVIEKATSVSELLDRILREFGKRTLVTICKNIRLIP